ncbi:MAG: hypothetical protein QOD28_511 [Acidobacteriota bacterium]|nr:hypothetical protein [Acidobacteriota bacterium]
MTDNNESLRELVLEYLRSGKVLHLASLSNDTMWMCHVWYAVGGGPEEIIFTSNKSRRHSRDIRNNSVVAGGVVAIDLEELGQKVRGLSFEGRAEETTGDAMERAYNLYAKRWPQVKKMFTAKQIRSDATDMRMYRVQLTRVVLFDEVNFPDNPRQELFLRVEGDSPSH